MTTARLADLKPWERNYNQGDVGAIYTSIATFGFNGTLRVWRDGIVVAGNHALKALQGMKQAGELPPEHIEVDADGEWLVPVTDVTHLDRMQAQAFAIADNRTRDLATADDAALAALLQEVANTDAALLAATGYDGDDLDVLLAELGEAGNPDADAEPQIDRAEELRQEWGTEPGQLWRLGEHRLICGDCTDEAVVERVMGGEKADLVWTDPPYGVAIGDKNKMLNSIGPSNRVERNLENDTLDEAGLIAMLRASFALAADVCTEGASWYVAAPAGPLHLLFGQALNELGIWRQTIQWVKNNATFSPMGVSYHWASEPIFYGWLPNGTHRYYGDRKQTTVWEIDRPLASAEHPTMKPLALMARAIEHTTRAGQIVFEPFSGSGSTLLAAEQLNRRCYAIEIDPGYVAVCLQRYQDATGITPELIED